MTAAQLRAQRMSAARRLGTHTAKEWASLIAWSGGRCVGCLQFRTLTKDHVRPVSAGGSDAIGNIQPLCLPCNASKADMDYRPTFTRRLLAWAGRRSKCALEMCAGCALARREMPPKLGQCVCPIRAMMAHEWHRLRALRISPRHGHLFGEQLAGWRAMRPSVPERYRDNPSAMAHIRERYLP